MRLLRPGATARWPRPKRSFKDKFHLCIHSYGLFLFVNSPKAKPLPGDFNLPCSDIPFLDPTPRPLIAAELASLGVAETLPRRYAARRMRSEEGTDMGALVSVQFVQPRKLAAVRRHVAIGGVGSIWRPALDQVWKFLGSKPGLRTDGHNVFLYHHPPHRNAPMNVDFGVEVTRRFETSGEVYATETPAGEAATAVHIGGYDRLNEAHDAIHAWAGAHQRVFAGQSWEIYGDWSDDLSKVETTVVYLLK